MYIHCVIRRKNPEAAYVEFRIGPAIDGEFLPRDPLEMTANGEANDVATMVGCLEEEMKAFLVPSFVGGEGTEKSTWDRAAMDAMIAMQLEVSDELVLDSVALVYMAPEEVSIMAYRIFETQGMQILVANEISISWRRIVNL